MELLEDVTFYASFDTAVEGDFGEGDKSVWTRTDAADNPKQRIFKPGYNRDLIGIAADAGVHGGALEFRDIVPHNGFLFFRAAGKVGYRKGGWGGGVSMWLKTDLDKRLKTPHVDPFLVMQRSYNNGAVWCDFSEPPRDLRLGAFSSLPEGETPTEKPESEQPIARAVRPPILPDKWHHLAVSWQNFDTGKANALVVMYLDAKPIARLGDLEVTMNWDMDQVRIMVGPAFVGWIDEFAVFGRPLSVDAVKELATNPAAFSTLANRKR